MHGHERVTQVAKASATAFPPPLRGRDREGGRTRQGSRSLFHSRQIQSVTLSCSPRRICLAPSPCRHPSPCPSPARGEGTVWLASSPLTIVAGVKVIAGINA